MVSSHAPFTRFLPRFSLSSRSARPRDLVAVMTRRTVSVVVVFAGFVLACSGRGHAPKDSSILYCRQDGLFGLEEACDGAALADTAECIEGEVRINCTAVFNSFGYGPPESIDEDRCASAEFIQDICGEIIPCSVGEDDTIYLRCGEAH